MEQALGDLQLAGYRRDRMPGQYAFDGLGFEFRREAPSGSLVIRTHATPRSGHHNEGVHERVAGSLTHGDVMSDNLKIRQPQDPTKINLSEKWERDYWTKKFNVSEQELKQAVSDAGGSLVTKVKEKLGKK
jgi:hypothetical protein